MHHQFPVHMIAYKIQDRTHFVSDRIVHPKLTIYADNVAVEGHFESLDKLIGKLQ